MVKIFLDSAKLNEIEKVKSWGLLDGVTTNPSLIKKASDEFGGNIEEYIKKILKVAKGKPVSLEVIGNTYKEMVAEGEELFKKFNRFGKNVYIKIPVNPSFDESSEGDFDGIKAIKTLSKKKIPVNCTLIFTPEQALLAAKAGAKFVSPFVGREDDFIRKKYGVSFSKDDYFPAEGQRKKGKVLEDEGIVSGVDLIKETRKVFDREKIKTKILAASIRNKEEFRECIIAGADIITAPFDIIESLVNHFKTAEGMKDFTKDIVPEYKKLVDG
jgi:transaldolase